MGRKRTVSEATPASDDEESQPASQRQASAALSSLSPQEIDKLTNDLCRYALLREHSKKPLSRVELKAAVLGADRKDPSGKLLKALIIAANGRLKELCGLEMVFDTEANADDESTQANEASQAQGSQAKSAATKGNLILVNRLSGAVRKMPSSEVLVYRGLVEVVLSILFHNDGELREEELFGVFLSKLGLSQDHKMPKCNAKVGDLVLKQMVSDAYLARKKRGHESLLVAGARAVLGRDPKAADEFKASLSERQSA